MAIVEKVDGFFIPNVTLIGVGAAKAIPERIVYLNATKPLLVTDKGIVHTGILKQITDILDEAAMEYAIYDETVPNPTDLNVAAGVELYKKEECDSLISIGGGSSHDCCKGIGLVVSNGGKIHDYEGVDKSTKAMPPYLAVNTTAGTASEITRFCIITDSARKVKMAIVDWRITPSVAINDPILMVGMPPALTAATGMDALTHAVEAYVSTGATPLTDACAEKAIKLVSENLRRAVANGSDIHAREGMCYAQYLAGMAFNNASLGHVHAMAHQLGGFYNLPHGECNAILLPIVEEYNLLAHLDKFINIARMMDENIDGLSKRDAAELAISAIRRLSQDVGIPASITELAKRYGKEVSRSDIPTMVANAQKDACGLTNPRKMTDAAVQQLYEIAFLMNLTERGRALLTKSPLPPSPHPQKLRLVGRQRGRSSVVWKEKNEPLIASFISFSVGEERRNAIPQFTPSKFSEENCSRTARRQPPTPGRGRR